MPFCGFEISELEFSGVHKAHQISIKGGKHRLVTLALGASKYGETLKQKMKITDVVINPQKISNRKYPFSHSL